jgi:hypothetical protein
MHGAFLFTQCSIRHAHCFLRTQERGFGGVDEGFPEGFVASLSATNAVLLGQVFNPYYNVV